MDSSIRAEDSKSPSFIADLNAPLVNSTLSANPLQIDLEPSATDRTDTINIVQEFALLWLPLRQGWKALNDNREIIMEMCSNEDEM